jgi:hypothetical protein
VVIVLVCVVGFLRFDAMVAAAGQQPPAAQRGNQAPPNMPGMMKMHEQMMAEMKASNAKLDALVKDMNAAAGDARIGALVAVVNELVRQHTFTHGRMAEMHQQTMGLMSGRGMMNAR